MERFDSFSSDQITLTKRQMSMLMASMLLFCLFVFIVGFFLGKRTLIEDFSSQITQETLHDQIDFLLTTQSLKSSQDDQAGDVQQSQSSAISLEEVIIPEIIAEESTVPAAVVIADNKKQKLKELEQEPVMHESQSGSQYAQLIGFGTKKAAQTFVARLKKYDIPVILKTVISKTASGKQRTWYQAITPTYQTAEQLQEQVAKIKRLEHIRDKDIKIVHIK